MISKESEFIDEGPNGLRIDPADEDGVQIIEVVTESGVYVYYSEIPKLIQKLQEAYNHR